MIASFLSRALKRFWEHADPKKLPPEDIDRILRILRLLNDAAAPEDLNVPGLHFHALRGQMRGRYAVTVRANWRITFGWTGEDAIDVDFEDYSLMAKAEPKHSKPHPDLRPCHPGEILREIILPAVNKPLSELAKALGITQKAFSDLVNEKTSLSPELAVRLEAAFGRTAPAWMRMQETYDLWHARRAIDVSSIPRLTGAA